MSRQDLVEEWISGRYIKPNSVKNARRGFSKFLQWSDQTPGEVLRTDPKDMRTSLLKFTREMLVKEYKINSILVCVNSVRAFFDFHGKPLGRIKNLPAMQKSIRDHVFSTSDLQRVWVVADVRYKAILATGCSLGWSINDLLKLDRQFISMKIKEAEEKGLEFIVFDDVRTKTGALSFGLINPFALRCLKDYLALPQKKAVRKENGEWRNDIEVNTLFTLKEDAVNKGLKKLCRDAGITLTGRVRFHMIRGWLISMLTSLGLSEQAIKLMVGKRIPYSDETYLERLKQEIITKYPQVYPSLSLDPANHENSKLMKVKEEFSARAEGLSQVIAEQQTVIRQLEANGEKKEAQIQTLFTLVNEQRKLADKQQEMMKRSIIAVPEGKTLEQVLREMLERAQKKGA